MILNSLISQKCKTMQHKNNLNHIITARIVMNRSNLNVLLSQILNNFSTTIKPGECVALVGSSGCGKSTVLQLLQRLYDPLSGSIKLDGTDLKKMNLKRLRSCLGQLCLICIKYITNSDFDVNYFIYFQVWQAKSQFYLAGPFLKIQRSDAKKLHKKKSKGLHLQRMLMTLLKTCHWYV